MCDNCTCEAGAAETRPLDGMDPDEKQWYIEVQTLEIEELNARQQIALHQATQAEAEADRAEALAKKAEAELELAKLKAEENAKQREHEYELAKLKAEHGQNNVLKVNCAKCGAELEYEGEDAASVAKDFQENHYNCE